MNLVESIGEDCYNLLISNLLTLLDKLAVAFCCKDHYKSLDKTLLLGSKAIQQYMDNHGYLYENFTPRLSPDCIIYGGFIFHVLMNTYDEDSDIDIIHYDTVSKDDEIIYSPVKTLTINRGKYNNLPVTYENCDQYLGNNKGTGMFIYLLNHIKEDGSSSDNLHYQHMTLLKETMSLKRYLNRTCDLDITKNYYDSKTDRIHIYSLDKLWERRDEIDVRVSYNRKFAHFNHIYHWTIKDFYYNYDLVISRVEKYRHRGINIISLHKYNSEQYLQYLTNIYHLDFKEPKDLISTLYRPTLQRYLNLSIEPFNRLIFQLDLEVDSIKEGTPEETKLFENYYDNFVMRKF
jgi:hypothetical protein